MAEKVEATEPVTLDEIRKIRLLSRSAAPRPWRVVYEQELPDEPSGNIATHVAGLRFADGAAVGFDWPQGGKTLEFIIHSCNAIVALADEVEKLRKENEQLRKASAPKAAAAGSGPGPEM